MWVTFTLKSKQREGFGVMWKYELFDRIHTVKGSIVEFQIKNILEINKYHEMFEQSDYFKITGDTKEI